MDERVVEHHFCFDLERIEIKFDFSVMNDYGFGVRGSFDNF